MLNYIFETMWWAQKWNFFPSASFAHNQIGHNHLLQGHEEASPIAQQIEIADTHRSLNSGQISI